MDIERISTYITFNASAEALVSNGIWSAERRRYCRWLPLWQSHTWMARYVI